MFFKLFKYFFNFIIIETVEFLDFFKFYIPNLSILVFSIYYLYKISFSINLDLEKNKFFKNFRNLLFFLSLYYIIYGCIFIYVLYINDIKLVGHYVVSIEYNVMQILLLLFFFFFSYKIKNNFRNSPKIFFFILIFCYLFTKISISIIYF